MDHDRLFKELLTTFFSEFVELFLPDVAGYMESSPLEFLDKEVFTDVAAAERHEVDLLVKARFRDRGEAFFLIHVENQSTAQDQFARRMFRYFARLHEKYSLPIFPVALLSYSQPSRPEPDHYEIDFPGHRVLDFAFRAIQLNRLNWRDYLRNPNPIASALMTKMQIAPADRPRVKLECLRMLATLKLDRARGTLVSVFMDSYLKLTTAEMIVYNREMDAIEPKEREVVMQWTNEWIEKGKTEGRQEGRRNLVLRQLRRRLGSAGEEFTQRVADLSDLQMDQLVEDLLDFQTLLDAEQWFARHAL
jgi:predicted transposase YdaD